MSLFPWRQSLTYFLGRVRPTFFSKREWGFYTLLLVLVFPIGAYLFMGDRFYQDRYTFAAGTLTGIFVYWVGVISFTGVGRWVIHQLPEQRQAGQRSALMVLALEGVMLLMAVFDLWVFSIVPGTGVQFSLERLQPIVLFGCAFVLIIGLAISLFHIYAQWQDRQTENEQLKRQALQQQYDALKWQVNPHFLFNSLSAISALIGEDQKLAERFVDNLAKVYRYMLKTGGQSVVPLTDELEYIQTYTDLLLTRYGASIQISLPAWTQAVQGYLPPLSLQTLIDNAIKHNRMTPSQPLRIEVILLEEAYLRVDNTRQPKVSSLTTNPHGLANLTAKYRQLSHQPVAIDKSDTWFRVTLPLLPARLPDTPQ